MDSSNYCRKGGLEVRENLIGRLGKCAKLDRAEEHFVSTNRFRTKGRVEPDVQVPRFWCMYVDEMARSSSPLRSFRVRDTGIGCLRRDQIINSYMLRTAYFFAVKNIFPRRRGRSGMTRSSARKSPFSRSSARRASNGLNFPFSFSTPTTRLMNLTPACSRRSLYSRCGSLVMRQTAESRGSTRGYLTGLSTE